MDNLHVTHSNPTRLRRICLTAEEAFPAFEELVLDADREIHGSFRIFDPRTSLVGVRARAVGETWADLLADALRRGVCVHLVLSDFDVIARPELHHLAHRCARELTDIATAEADAPGHLSVRVEAHPARMGLLPRLALWPVLRKHLRLQIDQMNELDPRERRQRLEDMPGLSPYVTTDESGHITVRALALPEVLPATHHQKVAVIDDETVYVGGLDLNNRRFDDLNHARPAPDTWHDVQLIVDGPIAKPARAHLARFTDETLGRHTPGPSHGFLRTLSAKRNFELPFMGPRPVKNELYQAHLDAIRRSEKLIYLETQFFREKSLAKALARRAKEAPDLNLVIMLPAAPEDVAFKGQTDPAQRHGEGLQLRCLNIVRKAFGDRVFVGSPAQPRRDETKADGPEARRTLYDAPIIYLHAKVSTFDSREAIVSSANLNGRSLHWDTEAGVLLDRDEDVLRVREKCMTHWLGLPSDAFPKRYEKASEWAQLASRNAKRPPEERTGFLLPYSHEDAREIAQESELIPDEVV